jgi:tetratricopeptide (TPR) repeat protein
LLIIHESVSQSPLSILGKAGGQLIQDLSKNNEWKSIGKAFETAGDMKYEMEKIKAQNTHEIIIKTNPEQTTRVYPAEGYKWVNQNNTYDYNVKKIEDRDVENNKTVDELLQKGMNCLLRGDINSALNLFSQSIEINPTPLAYFLRSITYSATGKFENALEDVGTTLNYDVSDEFFYFIYSAKSTIYQSMGKNEEVINQCNKALKLLQQSASETLSDAGNYCRIYNSRGQAESNLGNSQNALDDLNLSIKMCPHEPMGYFDRAAINAQNNKFNEAISDLDMAENMSQNGEMEIVYRFSIPLLRAVISIELKDYKQAIRYTNESIKIYDDNNMSAIQQYSTCYYLRGKAKIELEIVESGCSDLKKAIQLGFNSNDSYIVEHCR